MKMMTPPANRILVTGAAGGIGAACVAGLQSIGATVLTWDLPEIDVTDKTAVTTAVEHIGPLTALIHCAGIMAPDYALTPTATKQNFATNFYGVTNVCSQVARKMCDQGYGAIVVVSSNAATTPRLGMASYGASKAATTAWVKTLGLECAPYGVRCNIVSPGSTDTPMLRAMWKPGDDHTTAIVQGSAEQFRLGIPLRKIATPEDIAHVCIYLISDAAGHITMHDLRVDGGATFDT